MSLDGAMLKYVREELSILIGSRVEKISQPSSEEIVISFRKAEFGRGAKRVVFSAKGGAARVNLTENAYENPQTPPMFCMLLRKHLNSGRLLKIRQDGLERILYFDFECVNEIGDVVTNTLTAEIMGRFSNIILVRNGRVVDSIKRVTDEISGVRRILPNIVYETPPRPDRVNFFEREPAEIAALLTNPNERLARALPAALEGISPIFARECAFFSAGDTDAVCSVLEDNGRKKNFCEFFETAESKPLFTEIIDGNGIKKDFSFVDINQYGNSFTKKHFDSASALLDDFYENKSDSVNQRAREMLKLIKSRCERTARKVELQKKELSDCAGRERLRVIGDIINANIYRLEKGMTSADLEDFYSGEQVKIRLDARLSPAQNAQKYYSEYRKLCTAEKMLTKLIADGQNELLYLESLSDSVTRAANDSELTEIRRELAEQGFIRAEKSASKPKKSEPMKYVSSDGFVILVGKNNRQNDELTLKTAKASDIWLHVKDIAGSHVIIKTDGKKPPERTVVEAARLAAFHSKAKNGSGVPVDFTAVRFVKKPAGARPGMVIFTDNRTLFVTPSEEETNRLKTS